MEKKKLKYTVRAAWDGHGDSFFIIRKASGDDLDFGNGELTEMEEKLGKFLNDIK